MKSITLIGMMGSGKTTIGKILEKKLNIPSIDIDYLIEKNEELSISEIFKIKGEDYFRQIEAQTINRSLTLGNNILTPGGGAFENSETRAFLLRNTFVIYLETSPYEIFSRINQTNNRPLLEDNMSIEKISEIIKAREKNYKLAHCKILTDNKSPDKIADEILGVLKCKKLK